MRQDHDESPRILAGVARAVINPPLTIEQGVWGAKSHVTPSRIESDLWATCLVLSQGDVRAVIVDLDLCQLTNERAAAIRERVEMVTGIPAADVRVSVTHTHAGPVLRADEYSANAPAELSYLAQLAEVCAGVVQQADRDKVPVTLSAAHGVSTIGRNRRQRLDDGTSVTGFNPDGVTDTTVSVIRCDDDAGSLVASLVHYGAHPTTLGYTNDAVSPDYPGVTKRFVEASLGGTCLFLQGAAGDVGPGPGGFLSDFDVVATIGTRLGCIAVEALLRARESRDEYLFDRVVPSGADLGVWRRHPKPAPGARLVVRSDVVLLPRRTDRPVAEHQRETDEAFREVQRLRAEGADSREQAKAAVVLRRRQMALRRAKELGDSAAYPLEIHTIRIGDIVLIGVPIEPFCEIGMTIRNASPFGYTLFSGYSGGENGYLPTSAAVTGGGYEVDHLAFQAEAADLLVARVKAILDELTPAGRGDV